MANLDLINYLLDKAENRYRLTSLSSDTESHRSSCVPTGQLMLDACLAGGLPSGRWITVYGGEGSAKSTTMQTFMHAFGRLGIPGSYMDFEGSLCSQYLSHIIRTIGKVRAYESEGEDVVTKLFGLKGPNGKWVQKPLYRLYTEGVGDTFFNMLAEILRLLPDKVHVDGKWYLVYKEKPSDAKIDKTLSSRGAYYVEEPNGYPQMAEIIDSYPFMFPERLDTEDAGAGMAAVARMFSENIPKVAGKLRKKGVIILGVNQTRLNPGVRYGCFQGSTRVTMADGTTKTIGEIYAEKHPGPVLSYNQETKKYESKAITDWYDNGQNEDRWLLFSFSPPPGSHPNLRITFLCTDNHKLMGADGVLRAAWEYSAGSEMLHHEGKVTVVSVTSCNPSDFDDNTKYDIQVEGNHLYCVDGVVVHNSPEYEPGGQAVRFVSSVRISNAARSVPHGKGPVEREPSVLLEGDDQYKYIMTKLTKNKASTSLGIEFWQRLWAADPAGEAYGFDPVWDAWEFLGRTGQREGTLKKSNLRILSEDGTSVVYEKANFSLADLKHMMLLEGTDRVDYAKTLKMDKDTYKGLFASGKLHAHLHGQIANGTAQSLLYQTLNGVTAGLEENDMDEGDDDDADEV